MGSERTARPIERATPINTEAEMSPNKPTWDPEAELQATNQVAAQDELRRRCPVAYSEQLGWSLFAHADVMRVLEDHERFSNAVSSHLSVPNGMDPPEHTPYRQMIEKYFWPERVQAFQPLVEQIADELIAPAVTGVSLEVMSQLARRFASRVQCAFLGWSFDLEQTLIDWTLENSRASRDGDREQLSKLAAQFEAIVDRQLDSRARDVQGSTLTASDVTSELMREQVHDRSLSYEEISSILRNWTVGEIGTISASIGIVLHHLAVQPMDQHRLRGQLNLVSGAIDEILRVHNPLFSNRRVARCPVELGGQQLAAGEKITLHWVAANRDEAVFESPGEVQLERTPTHNLLYGAGVHACPGALLARMELTVFLNCLLRSTAGFELSNELPLVFAEMPESGFSELWVTLRN